MNKKVIILGLGIILISSLNAELFNFDKVLRNYKGLNRYKKADYQNASENFDENALEHPNDSRLHFNKANSSYKNGDLEAAENSYNLSLRDPKFASRSKALQNLGSIKFDQKQYPDAIKYFRDALIEDPQNADARHNYEVTSRLLQKQQNQEQQQQQNSDDQKEQDEKDKQENQDQNKDRQQNEDQEQQEQQKQDQEKNDEQKQEQKKLEKREKKEKEDAEKTLNAILQKEKEEQEKKKAQKTGIKPKSGKYW